MATLLELMALSKPAGRGGALVPVMFWTEARGPALFEGKTASMSKARVAAVVKKLRGGKVVESYKGHAYCRICDAPLGSEDMSDGMHIWPVPSTTSRITACGCRN